jgi:hypothetical protein
MATGTNVSLSLASWRRGVWALALPTALHAQDQPLAQRIADELQPRVEAAIGLRFRRPPRVAVRTRDQVRTFLNHKIAEQYPPAEMRGLERAYHALGLVDDTVDVRRLLLDLYSEQVAGFYDPDSSTLFVVRGGDPPLLRVTMAHELVHALQDQHTRLNAVLKLRRQNDRQTAGQAVFEGQATIAMYRTLRPETTPEELAAMVRAMREGMQTAGGAMPVLQRAPPFVVASMLFPYTEGAAFVLAFEDQRASTAEQPFGERLPLSTEQILHPARYASRDAPVRIALAPAAAGDTVLHEDNLGEFETREALKAWGLAGDAAIAAAAGWDGDRFRVMGTTSGTVVVMVWAWDSEPDAADFATRLRTAWTLRTARWRDASSRRFQIDRLTVAGVPVVRLVDAPNGWRGWQRLPGVAVGR